jgi:hypothetical protein
LKIKFLEGVEEIDLMDFYYSEYNGLDDPTESLLSVWPNPATETVHIEGSEVAEVQVYNAMGQLVKTVQGSNEINVSSLAEGVYLLRVTAIDGNMFVNCLIIK